MKTMNDVMSLLGRCQISTNPVLVAHTKTLVGPRTRGSTTTKGLISIPIDREIRDITLGLDPAVVSPQCTYYECDAPELNGKLGAISLEQAMILGLNIQVREGAHGAEAFAESDDWLSATVRDCRTITIIVDDFQGEECIATWHPGRPLAPISPFLGVKIETKVADVPLPQTAINAAVFLDSPT